MTGMKAAIREGLQQPRTVRILAVSLALAGMVAAGVLGGYWALIAAGVAAVAGGWEGVAAALTWDSRRDADMRRLLVEVADHFDPEGIAGVDSVRGWRDIEADLAKYRTPHQNGRNAGVVSADEAPRDVWHNGSSGEVVRR